MCQKQDKQKEIVCVKGQEF